MMDNESQLMEYVSEGPDHSKVEALYNAEPESWAVHAANKDGDEWLTVAVPTWIGANAYRIRRRVGGLKTISEGLINAVTPEAKRGFPLGMIPVINLRREDQKCENCVSYFDPIKGDHQGECRYSPPVFMAPKEEGDWTGRWPAVYLDDWCRKWEHDSPKHQAEYLP